MLRNKTLLTALGLILLLQYCSTALGQPPLVLRDYKFVPSESTLFQTGGFAGVDFALPISGTFGLVTGYEVNFPLLEPTAWFRDVEAVAAHPWYPEGLPLDDALNLSGLDGTFDDPNLLHFSGSDSQGHAVELQAELNGPWLHLTGGNRPGCCDFFTYEIDALARRTLFADFDLSGTVDEADLVMWEGDFGSAGSADANGDGMSDGTDFLAWQQQMVGSVAPGETLQSVPEPSTCWLALVGLFGVVTGRRR